MSISIWLQDVYHRIYPQMESVIRHKMTFLGALNERQAFQVAVRNESSSVPVKVTLSEGGSRELTVRIRRIGYVPVPRLNFPIMKSTDCEGLGSIPGYIPDPLFDENVAIVPPQETYAFWIDIVPKAFVKHGKYHVEISVVVGNTSRTKKVRATIHLADIKLKPRKDFQITHWFYADAIIDWYKTDGYDEHFWNLLPNYLKDLVDHGQDTVLVPIFTPPLDGIKTPCQLLEVKKFAKGKYKFDFSNVKKYIDISKKAGLKYFEWTHLGTQWGAANAIRVYGSQGRTRKLLWLPETKVTSETYKNFLHQLLPAWHDFMNKNNLLDNSLFHLSDEPHKEEHYKNYQAFREILSELAPWMKIMDAVSDLDFAATGLTDMPVASEEVVLDFLEKFPCWIYYCGGPRGKFLNHLMDTPLAKIAMHGILFYRWNLKGFLHWGYNYWYRRQSIDLIDPFVVNDAHGWPDWAHGDPFLVYPGSNGPIDSIRWEVFALAMQDYQLLQTLEINCNDKRLADVCSFEDFPKNANWRLKLRKKFLHKL